MKRKPPIEEDAPAALATLSLKRAAKRQRRAEANRQRRAEALAEGQCQMLRGLDRQQQLAGIGGLATFRPLPERCAALGPNEMMYAEDMDPWDANRLPATVPWKRLCVKDLSTGNTRFEVSACGTSAPPQ